MGRPAITLCGLTAVQWATALGDTSKAGLHRARQSLAGRRIVPADEAARVADSTGVDLAELTRALAALRGYLAPDAPASDPDGPALVDGD